MPIRWPFRPLSRTPGGRDEILVGPIRGELLGAEHLGERARRIAASQRIFPTRPRRRRTPLLARLDETRRVLDRAHARLGDAAARGREISPAGDWLLDNYHVVEEHILAVRASLPAGYYRELPELAGGSLAGFPRAYEIAITLISHTEARIDLDNTTRFVGEFQRVTALSLGELWAMPAMLRLGLIESVRRMALRTVQRMDEVELADGWAERLRTGRASEGEPLGPVVADFVARPPPLTATFVSRLLQLLHTDAGAFHDLDRLERWLAQEGITAEVATAQSIQRLALTQLMMTNSITSLRAVARLDWQTFVESQSRTEATLRADPSGCYPRMTFDGRDRYRHAVERIARRSRAGEEAVARAAIELAQVRHAESAEDPRGHVGYYLIDEGLATLEQSVGYRPRRFESLVRWLHRHPNLALAGGIVAGTGLALAVPLWLVDGLAIEWVIVVAVAFVPASDIAVTLLNQLVTATLPPRLLPRLDLHRDGVPPELRTAVVIPILLESVETVAEALETLEVRFLANRGPSLHFALLSDLTDSATETREGDEGIVTAARAGIEALNARYAPATEDAFYLLHRPRRWNPVQRCWMGWERKRGKLAQFNRFIRGAEPEAFSVVVGNVGPLAEVKYVITLDADTVLPPDTVPDLVGTLAHPLNRAEYDPASGRVVRGYGILQPRVGVSLPSAHRSRFAAVYSGSPGVDPYTTAVSDVYQDLFGEGSFTGKGIYEVDTFERATQGRFPENRLLSHDLIEGNYARTALVTDINLYDDYPGGYLSYTRRKHRWIRGDWQLLQWLGPTVPGPDGLEKNRLSFLSRWKILDNLRRSVVELAQLGFLVAGWTVLPGSPIRWTLLGLLAIAAPWVVATLAALGRPSRGGSWRTYLAVVGRDAARSAGQVGLAIGFLPHQAWISADAIVRTLWRLVVSRRRLLEWETASTVERAAAPRRATLRAMAPTLGLVAIIAVVVGRRLLASDVPDWGLLAGAAPFLAVWLLSPAIATALGRPAIRSERRLPPAARRQALRYALLHWRYFERFVGPDTNWLAPDNFQEDPAPVTAMRTSPTNIGLQLLATVSAHDLGFLPVEALTVRLERAFATLARMRRFRGHFFNWYDVGTLSVLEPAYVSSVDSGNLAGHLIALRQACLTLPDSVPEPDRVRRAMAAALEIARERLETIAAGTDRLGPAARRGLAAASRTVDQVASDLLAAAPVASAATRLRETIAVIESAGLASEEHPVAVEWIEWSLRMGEEPVAEGSLRDRATRSPAARALIERLTTLAERAYDLAMAMQFRFLYDPDRKLLSIGYQLASHSLDAASYDLLASEARLASFVAIAKNDLPVEHWFRLGRTLTRAAGGPAMVSWSGSMFEYLMPTLVMQSFPRTLLDQTYRSAVRGQIGYGAERGVPWGISESAYHGRDRHFTYQYRAFGVPELGLKRGLARELVVAPYASALAALVDPERALLNLAEIERLGVLGPFGFRDAIDYTRPAPDSDHAVVASYMAHHVGMTVVALTNVLSDRIWQRRFHHDPLVQSVELLLHERIPRRLVLRAARQAADGGRADGALEGVAVREIELPDTPEPRIALLGRPPFTVMISHCGGGYSRYQDLAVARWRADSTRDDTGQFCYLKDLSRGRIWSAAHQPTGVPADWYRATLATDRVTFHRADGDIETRTEVAVVPEDAAEVRRVTVTNNGTAAREIELTSYGEVVLGPPDADRAHPAFGNLFVETEWHEWCAAVTAVRRPRSATEPIVWCVHVVATGKERVGPVSCETDRARFQGRGRSKRDPVALTTDGPLSGTTGPVLDPIVALRTRVRVDPGQSAPVTFTTLIATNRERAFALADRYHDPHAAQRALDLATTSSQVELRELSLTAADATVFQELAGHLFFSSPAARAPEAELLQNRASQLRLWAHGVSGDWPIVVATISAVEGMPTLRQILAAHRYWRRRGMTVDLVVLNAHPTTYQADLDAEIAAAIHGLNEAALLDRPGGVFVRRRDLLGATDLLMFRATARLLIPCDGRSLGRVAAGLRSPRDPTIDDEDPLVPRRAERSNAPRKGLPWRLLAGLLAPERGGSAAPTATSRPSGPTGALRFDNGLGGLTPQDDYEIRVEGDRLPPAPWINVIATERGGFTVSERGAGFTWAGNSHFFRLTPWHNDPVGDPPTEVIYLRDEDTGDLWCPTPAPVRGAGSYTIRHAPGTSTFRHEHAGIATELRLGMAPDRAVKCAVLRLTNRGTGSRRLTITAYLEWTLGILREHTQHQVVTSLEPESGAILARNSFAPDYSDWVAFHAISEPVTGHTADRREFLGRNGWLGSPEALAESAIDLSGATGAGLDPCSALQCQLTLAATETREITVLLGAAPDPIEARQALESLRPPGRAAAAIAESVAAWEDRLGRVVVRTPEPSFDAIQNRWALYQALGCRIWGRSALYQSSGAYGFRDQLQDVMALAYAEPGIAREHILRATSRQFLEGDVQHWWHPETGRGIRTRFSDDLAWLPYVVDHYLRVTGDRSVLDEPVPFLRMRELGPGEPECYDLPEVTALRATVHDHCILALRRASTAGAHGLPLIGGGDWNDGMNRVGIEGRGESVWLAWFLIATLRGYAGHAEARGEAALAEEFRAQADRYREAVETHGWDGGWYRRAFFDDGAPLGSRIDAECRIDSIAQSWSVISGAGDPSRQAAAMAAVERHLVREDLRLIQLLDPPFDRTPRDPGYIKGYLPGVRENGAQYTHAALWVVQATALRGDGDRAFELYQMLNPLTHARTSDEVAIYQVEPYVVAADVSTARGRLGRGGWTWYTGSASWMYRVGLEGVLGLTKRGDELWFEPAVPRAWPEFSVRYRHGRTTYSIVVRDPAWVTRATAEVTVDGRRQDRGSIRLVDDGGSHQVVVAGRISRPETAPRLSDTAPAPGP